MKWVYDCYIRKDVAICSRVQNNGIANHWSKPQVNFQTITS